MEDRNRLMDALEQEFKTVLTPGAFEALRYFLDDQYSLIDQRKTEIEGNDVDITTLYTNKLPFNRSNFIPQAPYDSGTAEAGGLTSLTDTNKTWEVNVHTDRAVLITNGTGSGQCRAIVSNTANELFISGTWAVIPDATSQYEILFTKKIGLEDLNTIHAADLNSGHSCAFILPDVGEVPEGKFIRMYIERHSGSARFFNVCVEGQTQLGSQQGELTSRYESATLYTHQYFANHWDVLDTAFIERRASCYLNYAGGPVAGHLTYAPLKGTWMPDILKRFKVVTVDGDSWLEYTSLVQTTLPVLGRIVISPDVTGAQRYYLTVRFYDKSENTTTDYENFECIQDLFNSSDYRNLVTNKNLTFNLGDRVTLVDKNDNITRTYTPIRGILEIG